MSKEKQIEEMACKNCIHYQRCVDTFRKGKQDGEYLLIEEDAYFAHADGCDFYADKRIYRKQAWISVDERLPEVGTRVVGYDYESNVRCYFITEDRWWIDDGWNTAKGWGITHWMPLPEPPKTKGGAE